MNEGTDSHHNGKLLSAKGNEQERATAKAELITSNMPLAKFLVQEHIETTSGDKHLRDDLLSEAYLALVQVAEKPCRNFSAVASRAITRAIQRASLTSPAVHEPPGSRTHNRKAGRQVDLKVTSLGDDGDFITSDIVHRDCDEHEQAANTLDSILLACQTDVERSIVEMRIDGYKDGEIAAELSIPRRAVNDIRHAIEDRLIDAGIIAPRLRRRSPTKSLSPTA